LRNETYISALSVLTFARKTVDLTMAYFSPDDQVEEALVNAAHRGVRVRLLLAGLTDFDGIMHAGRAHYTELLEAGVQIFESQRVLLHAKTLEVDGIWSSVGSANWDWRSFAANDELNVVIIDEGFALQMQTQFATDLASASQIALSEWKQRPLRDRALQQFWVLWERLL
jgi:cardiolipin synthase